MKNIEKAFLAIKLRGRHPFIFDDELYIGAFYGKDFDPMDFDPMDFKVPDSEIDYWVAQYEKYKANNPD